MTCAGKLALALPLLLAGACGDDDHSHEEADAGHDCDQDTRGEDFVAGMEKTGGGYTFTLVDGQPAPPAKGNNVWTLEVSDPGGPAEGGEIAVTTFMPDHGHGSPIAPEITEEEPGRFALDPVNLFMPGLWEITIELSMDGAAQGEAVFQFCIDG